MVAQCGHWSPGLPVSSARTWSTGCLPMGTVSSASTTSVPAGRPISTVPAVSPASPLLRPMSSALISSGYWPRPNPRWSTTWRHRSMCGAQWPIPSSTRWSTSSARCAWLRRRGAVGFARSSTPHRAAPSMVCRRLIRPMRRHRLIRHRRTARPNWPPRPISIASGISTDWTARISRLPTCTGHDRNHMARPVWSPFSRGPCWPASRRRCSVTVPILAITSSSTMWSTPLSGRPAMPARASDSISGPVWRPATGHCIPWWPTRSAHLTNRDLLRPDWAI